jgi:Protein of unknown function (DUF1565)
MSQVIGTVYDGSDRAVKHDVAVPSGVTTAMTAVFVMGTGSSKAVDIDLSSPGVEFTRHVVGNAGKTRVAVFSVVGLAAGDVVTVTLSGPQTLTLGHWYDDSYTVVAHSIAAATRSASVRDTTSGSLTPIAGQTVLVIGVERTTTPSLSSATTSGGEAITQILFGEGTAAAQASVYAGTFTASDTKARTATVTYSHGSANGFAALLLTKPTGVRLGGGGLAGGFAAQLFVATSGDNSNAGTSADAPLRTIKKAFSKAVPGTTISVADGTYTGNVAPSRGGTAGGGHITLRSANKHGAKIIGELLVDKEYIEIRDMEITGPDSVRFACDVTADHVTIRGNKIHDICRHEVDDDGGSAIEVYSADGDFSEMHDVVIDGNIIFNVGRKPGADEVTQGIYLSVKCVDGRVVNNLVYRVCDFGIHSFHHPDGWTVMNNTVVGCGRGILTGKDFRVRNNISCDNLSANYDVRGSGNQLSNNIAFGTGGGSGIAGVKRVDPRLINPTITGSGDFSLRSDSPARNGGSPIDAPPIDINGTSRPQGPAPDIGAFEMPVG